MEENNETRVEQPVVVNKSNKGALWLLIIIIILLLGACGFFAYKYFGDTPKCGESKTEEKKEEKKKEKKEETPCTCNCPNDKKPPESNYISKAETINGYTLYQTNNGFYLSYETEDGSTAGQKEYVIGDRYLYAYKIDFTTNYGIPLIEQLTYGNGGSGMFVFLVPNGEQSNTHTLYYIDLYYTELKDNMKPVTNDKLKDVAYVYSESKFGGADAYAVTSKGEKIDLYDFVKQD